MVDDALLDALKFIGGLVGYVVSAIVGFVVKHFFDLYMARSQKAKTDSEADLASAEANGKRASAAETWQRIAAEAAQSLAQFQAEKTELEEKLKHLENEVEAQAAKIERQAIVMTNQEKMITQLAGRVADLRTKSIKQEAQIIKLTQERDELRLMVEKST